MNSEKEKNTHFIVTFRDPLENKILSLRAQSIKDSALGLGFICISDFVYQSESAVINPVEENLKKRFKDTKSYHLSIYNIVSVEEVGMGHQGFHFQKDKSNLMIFPTDRN